MIVKERTKTWVEAGDKFAGGILTETGAAEVNGHRERVLNGEKSVTEKVLDAYYRKPGVTPGQLDKAKGALDTTPW